MKNPKFFSLYGILPINAIEVMKLNLNRGIPFQAVSTQEQTCSLPSWPQLGMVSAVWGMSVFEKAISARLAVGLNFCKCLMYKNCP